MPTSDPHGPDAETGAPDAAHEAPPSSDADLVLRTRGGDTDAFGELWRRHYRSGITVARSTTSSLDADDLVQEAYARIYQSILRGGGPTGSFRAYLFTSIRNTAAAWGRARKETAIDELEAFEDPSTSDAATEEALDRSLTHQAFRSLPTRWQEVLWYTEIEQMKPREIAPLLGLKATAVAQLAFRAREGLREAWVQAHLRTVEDGSDCQWTIERLGAHARDNLGARDRRKVDAHLGDCARCSIVACEAKEVSNRLALVLLPLTVGVAGSAAYLASIQGGGTPLVALAMPSTVVEGGVGLEGALGVGIEGVGAAASVVGAGAFGLVGSSAGGAGGSAAGGSAAGAGAVGGGAAGGSAAGVGAAGAAAAGGGFGGVSALVGLAAASVLVAGGVAAAAVLPGVLDQGSAAASSAVHDAGASPAAPLAALIGPDESGRVTITLPDNTIPDGPAPDDVPPQAPAPEVSEAPAPPEPALPVTPPVVAPEKPGGAAPPAVTEPGTDEPGITTPGTDEPGGDPDPGTDEPGPTDPGTDPEPGDPGTTDPEPEGPGTGEDGGDAPGADPGDTDPSPGGDTGTDPEPGDGDGTDPEVALPDGAPSFASATARIDEDFRTHVTITVEGEAGATVRLLLDSEPRVDLTLDGTGVASVTLRPTALELLLGRLHIAYVAGDEVGASESVSLAELLLR